MATITQLCRRCLLIRQIAYFALPKFKECSYRNRLIREKNILLNGNGQNLIRIHSTSRGFGTVSFKASKLSLESDKPSDCTTFQDLGNENRLHPKLVKTLSDDLKFNTMMPIQKATIRDLIDDRANCLAQAKTGTGKTIAFLLPAIQTLVTKDPSPGKHISLLVLSPTRELALQIAEEAKGLLQRFFQYKVRVCIGGTNKEKEQKDIIKNCDILIATPGRLLDHLSEPRFIEKFQALDTLVLDEADRLLDMGFMKDIERIISYLPDKVSSKRQAMLFSATQTPRVSKVADLVLGKDYKFISTIPVGEKLTHERVIQKLITVPKFSDLAPALFANIQREVQLRGSGVFKTIVFAPTAALADFYGHILQSVSGIPNVSVLHSRASQKKRNRIIAQFREAKTGVLVATDVVARGIDIPAVTDVIQVGLPMNKEAYIHRLGRTARAGTEGGGMFFLTEAEKFFPSKSLADIKFLECQPDLSLSEEVLQIAANMEEEKFKKIYQSWIGYYRTHIKEMGWTAQYLVVEANKFAKEGLRAPEIPMLTKDTIAKMGLRGMNGFNIKPKKARNTNKTIIESDAT
ncbi:hypothetical protein EPUL_001238 [Erysiphe pulchra]|uniref:ATP-dependent RNA helicase n=1 Tax=Erysiphe pulchra TaxID=225359 RepID=A0A2S4PWW1_9PEZI|nr:hypothetical protein EPUL_001238 [Erysiphe pulchra]